MNANAFEEDKHTLDQLVLSIDVDACRRGYLRQFGLYGELDPLFPPVECIKNVVRKNRYVDERHQDYMATKHPYYRAESIESKEHGRISKQRWSVSLSASKFQ